MEVIKEAGKGDRKKESSVHTLRPFLATPLWGGWCLLLWQGGGSPNSSILGAAFSHYKA